MIIVLSFFACAILIGGISVTGVKADPGYDRGEKLKGFTFDHDKASESKAKITCDGDEECIECIEHRADLQGLKGYEVVKCLKEPDNYDY